MGHMINIASFTCGKCGHKSTPPEALNAISHQMEVLEKTPIPTKIIKDEQNNDQTVLDLNAIDTTKELLRKASYEQEMTGNIITIGTEGSDRIIRAQRSYSKVAFQSGTVLEESDHIKLACPQCDEVLYEVKWK